MPARLHRRGALGVGRLIGEEPSRVSDGCVFGPIGSRMSKGFWRHVPTAMRVGVGEDLGVPPRDPALVVAAPGAVVLDVERNVCVSEARRRRRAPVHWRLAGAVAPA
jgi:hypothetical protein